MYVLRGLIGRRGFKLEHSGKIIFETSHRLPSSRAHIAGNEFKVVPANLVGDKWEVFKNDERMGELDFSYYSYSRIKLERFDGGEDIFRIDEDGYSQVYILSQSGRSIFKLDASINPLRIDEKFDIHLLSDAYSGDQLHELILYAGEVLYRMVRPNNSAL